METTSVLSQKQSIGNVEYPPPVLVGLIALKVVRTTL
jgi:hypothetical protein